MSEIHRNKLRDLTPLQRCAKLVVSRELASYDLLSQRSRIVYEHKVADLLPTLLDKGTRACAHGVMLHQPCSMCERTIEDCRVYEVALQSRVKELLAILDENA